MVAIVMQMTDLLVYQSARPCSAHSSFNGELQALLDAVEYVAMSLQGQVVIISDNKATLGAACSNAPHSGFAISLSICKILNCWFWQSEANQLQFRWFPSHTGFAINELADALAGQDVPCVPPPIIPTTASRKQMFMAQAVMDWRLQALPLMQARRIQLKIRRTPMQPQLWGAKGCQFFDLVGNDMGLLGRFTRLISDHAPIGSYRQKFFPQQNMICPMDGLFQDVQHITVQCLKYSAKFSSFPQFLFSNKNAKKLVDFLKQNLTAVSFEDQPLDIDLPPWKGQIFGIPLWGAYTCIISWEFVSLN